MSEINGFNLRVYAIILNGNDEVLISDERRNGVAFTKFPGGGLEFGEGLADGLRRELQEELNIEAEIGELFYVNDFFQKSAFGKQQLISFYYGAFVDVEQVPVSNHSVPLSEEGEKFRWVKLNDLSEDLVTFPIDKHVVSMLKEIEL